MDLVKGFQKYSVKIKECTVSFTFSYNPDSDELILFLHGLACSSASFRNLFDKDYFPNKSLLVIDLPGFGESAKPESFSYSMEDMADVVKELVELLPPLKIHIAAHSMGGAAALLFPDKFYERVLSFANIEGNLISEDCGLLSRGVISVPFEDYKAVNYLTQRKEFAGHEQMRFDETTPQAVYNSAKSLVNWSDSGKLPDKFASLKCRKCYFFGEENSGMPVLQRLGMVPAVMISGSGHAMMTENPEEFYSKLRLFVNS
jgi:pimeloyl-ACP methyl ester carboxylesterase